MYHNFQSDLHWFDWTNKIDYFNWLKTERYSADSKATNPFLSTHRYKNSYSISKRVTILVQFHFFFCLYCLQIFYYCHLNDQPKFEGQWKGYMQESELTFLFCYENEVQLIRQRSFSSWFFFPLIRFEQNETDFSVFHIHTRSTCWVFKM